ncbi:MAG TPA: immunity protein Tsi6 family protein [Kofleriaceae bacterium]|nr:immunity protein Tsi6 family protein [Kofleriaceae bacterium]
MSGNPSPEQLPGLIDKGLAMVEERLQRSNGARVYDSIKAQLTYMKQVVTAGDKPTDEKLDSLTMAVYAAREFETSDPDFADVLFDTEYLFKRL